MDTETKHNLMLHFLSGVSTELENRELYRLLETEDDEAFTALCEAIWNNTETDSGPPVPENLQQPPAHGTEF